MEDLHDRQLVLQVKITNSFQNFKSKRKGNMNEDYAECRLYGLEKNYPTFHVNHEKILKLEDLDKSHVYFTSSLHDLVEDFLKPLRKKPP